MSIQPVTRATALRRWFVTFSAMEARIHAGSYFYHSLEAGGN
jgi:hypothetical protein